MTMRLWKTCTAAFAAIALAASCATPQEPAQQAVAAGGPIDIHPAGWANDRGDLPKDPDYTLGVLPNGMRYLILPNKTPPGQVAMRLVIAAGSMQERPGEEGIAHYLEHLAFRGTNLFPDGELQRRLEGLGLQMGADANASTGADRTTFMFNLARNDVESLDTGLLVLREIVSEMRIEPALVEAERGVVLAEERARAGPALEATKQSIKLQVGEHPYNRAPIGLKEVIEKVTPEQIRVFYDAYYRPERATLIVVGDMDPKNLIPAIASRFGNWAGRGEPGADPQPVMVKPPAPDVAVQVTAGAPDTSVALRWFQPYRVQPPTLAERRRALVESLGAGIIGQRMQGITEAAGRPARLVGSPNPSRIAGVWNGQSATAIGVIDVAASIDTMVKAHRQAVQFGVSQAELDRIIELRLTSARQAAAVGRTGQSPLLADSTAASLASDPAFVSPKDNLAILESQIKTITLDEVNAALRSRFSGEPTLIYRGGKPPEGGEAALRAAYAKASAATVTAYAVEAVKPWPYSDFGTAGKVAERREVADLGITFVRFENGVRLSIKPFTAQKDQIGIQVRLGLGRLGMPSDRIDASDMGLSLWSSGGLGKLTRTEQSRTLAGKRVAASARTADDAYVLDNIGITTRTDLGLQMQLMAAMVTDPAYRADDWTAMMSASDQSEAAMPFSATSVMQFRLQELLHSGDLRWTVNTKAQRDTWKPEDSVAYIRPIVAKYPIEIVVVGDVDAETMIAETAKTFGALPPRPAIPEPAGLRDVKFPAPGKVVLTHKGRADQGFALIAWPTGQGMLANLRDQRVGWVLGQMLRDDATRALRTGSGATYSPSSNVDFSRVLPDYGFIGLMIEIPPDKIDGVQQQMQAIATRLASSDIPQGEIDRIIGPRIEQTKREQASSAGYWMGFMAGAQTDPRPLELMRTQLSDYQSITPADVQAAARRWLKPETAWQLRVVPEK